MNYNTATLANGLRVIHLPSTSPVVYCGYQIAAGTRHEEPGEEGLAHFCEHVTFKGTKRLGAMQIINSLERLGGELNAYTNKEDTTFYAAIHSAHFNNAVDLLTEIVFSSTYPQAEIEKETEVICDEIESYEDSPSELIYDDFEGLLFQGHPLGHNILGDAMQLRSYTTEDALRFTRRHYRPANAVFFAYGDVDFKRLVKRLKTATGKWKAGSDEGRAENVKQAAAAGNGAAPRGGATPAEAQQALLPQPPAPEAPARTIVRQKDTHQAHVMTGCRAFDINHPQRMALYLLNNLLGGPGMNSRLNVALRERHGLVYTVESTMVSYSDAGLWAVYYGCDTKDVAKCRRLVRQQLDRLMEKPLSAAQLGAAKQQLKGQIAIACDNRESFALDFGKSFLHYGTERHLDTLFQRIEAVKAGDIQQVARQLFAADNLTTLIYQ